MTDLSADQQADAITHSLGERCHTDFDEHCMTCVAWQMFDQLADLERVIEREHAASASLGSAWVALVEEKNQLRDQRDYFRSVLQKISELEYGGSLVRRMAQNALARAIPRKSAEAPDCPRCEGFLMDGVVRHSPKCSLVQRATKTEEQIK